MEVDKDSVSDIEEVDKNSVSDFELEIESNNGDSQDLVSHIENTNSTSFDDDKNDNHVEIMNNDLSHKIAVDEDTTGSAVSNDSTVLSTSEKCVEPAEPSCDDDKESQNLSVAVEQNDFLADADINSATNDSVDEFDDEQKENCELEISNQNSIPDVIDTKKETDHISSISSEGNIIKPIIHSQDDSEFLGFDSETTELSLEKTNELIQVLQDKEEELARLHLLHNSTKNADLTQESEESKSEFTLEIERMETTLVDTARTSVIASDLSSSINTGMNDNQSVPMSAEMSGINSRKSHPVHPVLGVPVNIFEEQVPSGSKRVKKKRKFFGDFEESDAEKTARRSSSSRPSEDGTKLLNNISGENKENFITDEELKLETTSEVDTSSQNKTKRSYTFDISNPLFREPFKYGWKREICYRNLPEGSKSKPAYVSYYSPQGKRFKTIRQIVELLPPDSELDTHHFTFSVQRIFSEPSEFEILRDLKVKTDINEGETFTESNDIASFSSDHSKFISKKKTSRIVIKKPKFLKQSDSEDDGSEPVLLSSVSSSTTPKIVIKGPSLNSAKSKSNSVKKDKKSSSQKVEKNSKKSLNSTEHMDTSMWEHTNSFDSSSPTFSNKRKLSDDSDISTSKIMKLDGEQVSHVYRSALTISNVAHLYNPLSLCFKYLTIKDLLRVSMSCKYFNRIASERNLWTTVRLKNSKVHDWDGFARTLRKYGTKKLDMRKMLCPSSTEDVNTMWNNFLDVIVNINSLEHIEFSRCNAQVVESVARTCPNLVVMNAVQLRNGEGLSMESFTKLKYLRELRLKGSTGLNMEPCNNKLDFQSKEVIQVLSLTSIKNMDSAVVEAVGDLINLTTLELGECNPELVDLLAVSIGRLKNLQRLRLEQITNLDPDFKLFESLKSLPLLTYLELINIEVRMGFCEAIAACENINNLLIIPLYKTESATSNRLIMDSLEPLSKSLKTFVWGLTHELIRATDLYATQFLEKRKGSNNEEKTSPTKGPDSIPIVKRISMQPEVDILSVRNLEKILAALLPRTNIKVVTVPFALTWRQSLSELFK